MSTVAATAEDQKPVLASRRRSSKACLSCRARKVRCDVTHKGRPCTNCGLDKKPCVVTRRGSYKPPGPVQNDVRQISAPPAPEHNGRHALLVLDELSTETSLIPNPKVSLSFNHEIPLFTANPQGCSTGVTFAHHMFISVGNVHSMLPADLNYLESQGCLRVPERSVFDQLVQQYFRHIHPILPLMDEADFWDTYYYQRLVDKIPLVLLQAMLFAACNHVTRQVIQTLGFSTTQEARSSFYRKAKLLYEVDSEPSLITRAQTCLLFAYYCPQVFTLSRKQNISWLQEAIQHATSLEAHVQASASTAVHHLSVRKNLSASQGQSQSLLKRLWWCCILCDRTLSLATRTSLQIPRARFDVDACHTLGHIDLSHEVGRSPVYKAETKRRLVEVIDHIAELCIALTSVLELVYPLDCILPAAQSHWIMQGDQVEREIEQVEKCKFAMSSWFERAKSRFPAVEDGKEGTETAADDLVKFHVTFMFMQYQTAKLALCNHEILLAHLASITSVSRILNNNRSVILGTTNIGNMCLEAQESVDNFVDYVVDLSSLGSVANTPVCGVAYMALPLLLSLIDVRLLLRESNGVHNGSSKKRLNAIVRALGILKVHFTEDIDFVVKTSQSIVESLQIEFLPTLRDDTHPSLPNPQPSHGRWATWGEILKSQPAAYLRLVLAMDVSLSQKKLPTQALRSTLTTGSDGLGHPAEGRQVLERQVRTQPIPTPTSSASHGVEHSFLPSHLTGSTVSPAQLDNDIDVLCDSTAGLISQDSPPNPTTSLMAMQDIAQPPDQSFEQERKGDSDYCRKTSKGGSDNSALFLTTNQQPQPSSTDEDWNGMFDCLDGVDSTPSARGEECLERVYLLEYPTMEDY